MALAMDNDVPHISVVKMTELAIQARLLHKIVDVINMAFTGNLGFKSEKPRYSHDLEMVEQIGDDGFCAVMIWKDEVVATASIKKWRPPVGGAVDNAFKEQRPSDHLLADVGLSWEVKAVATVDRPEVRGKGMAGQCIAALQARILSDSAQAAIEGLLLWIQLAEDQAGSYWRRRGYIMVGVSELKPKGTWGALDDFWFSTLVKRVKTVQY